MKCPFCKKDTAKAYFLYTVHHGNSDGCRVICDNLKCQAEGPRRSTKKLATAAWERVAKNPNPT